PSIAEHPIGLLTRLRFRVTVNTHNRLMSDITLSQEMHNLLEAFGFGWDEIAWLTVNAMKSAFGPLDQRLRIIQGKIKPGFAALRAEELSRPRRLPCARDHHHLGSVARRRDGVGRVATPLPPRAPRRR